MVPVKTMFGNRSLNLAIEDYNWQLKTKFGNCVYGASLRSVTMLLTVIQEEASTVDGGKAEDNLESAATLCHGDNRIWHIVCKQVKLRLRGQMSTFYI